MGVRYTSSWFEKREKQQGSVEGLCDQNADSLRWGHGLLGFKRYNPDSCLISQYRPWVLGDDGTQSVLPKAVPRLARLE